MKSIFVKCFIIFELVYFSLVECCEPANISSDSSKSIFEKNFIVPDILPSVPQEICSVFYNPGVIIVEGRSYFPYQIQDLPDISWKYNVEKFYTVLVIGALQEESVIENSTDTTLQNDPKVPPVNSWYQWVLVNIRKNNLNSGIVLQPYLNDTSVIQPNATHKVIQIFAVIEQSKKVEIDLNNEDNTPSKLILRYFTPLKKFIDHFKGSFLLAGNFYYLIPKPSGIVLHSSKVRYFKWHVNKLMNMAKRNEFNR